MTQAERLRLNWQLFAYKAKGLAARLDLDGTAKPKSELLLAYESILVLGPYTLSTHRKKLGNLYRAEDGTEISL